MHLGYPRMTLTRLSRMELPGIRINRGGSRSVANILISAIISPHNPPDLILQSWLSGDFELLASEDQLEEALCPDALRKAAEFNGCQAICSNIIADPIEAMKIYRQRNIIEQGFQQLKNEVGGDRLRATETTYRGKIFLYSVAQAVRMSILQTAKAISVQNKELSLPDDSLT